MKIVFSLITVLLFSNALRAEQICDAQSIHPEDIRILESDLSHEKAKDALSLIESIVEDGSSDYDYTSVANALRILEGYSLKKKVLEHEGPPTFSSTMRKSEFCSFLSKKGWLYE